MDCSSGTENAGQGGQTGEELITSQMRMVMAIMTEHALRLPLLAERSEFAPEAALGYLHPGYAESLAEFGVSHRLPACGGWVLERGIPGVDGRDAMGCYPVFVCRHWKRLPADLAALCGKLVTLVLVTDPFAEVAQTDLESCFDLVRPFKRHYITDLTSPWADSVSKHHHYYTRRAQRELDIEVCEEPLRYAQEWTGLYDHLVRTHHIHGLRAFSPRVLPAAVAGSRHGPDPGPAPPANCRGTLGGGSRRGRVLAPGGFLPAGVSAWLRVRHLLGDPRLPRRTRG